MICFRALARILSVEELRQQLRASAAFEKRILHFFHALNLAPILARDGAAKGTARLDYAGDAVTAFRRYGVLPIVRYLPTSGYCGFFSSAFSQHAD